MTTSVTALSYVFGVVSADAALPDVDEAGPAEGLRLVEADGLAAVVGTPPADRPLGRAADLLAHDRVLAALVDAGTTVLPMRFGTVLENDATVIEDVLTARQQDLRAQLHRIEGGMQFTLTARYEQDVILREVLAAHPDIARLRTPKGADDAGTFDRRLRLGELVVRALEQSRSADVQAVLDDIRDTVDIHVHKTTDPEMVLNAAVFVQRDRAAAFERGIERLAERHHPRLRIRLVGPSPAYDFVGTG